MATSGSFNTTPYANRNLIFSWSRTSYSVADNQSTIYWTLTGGGSAEGYYHTQNIKVTIDGVVIYNFPQSEGQIQLRNGTLVASGYKTFTHNNDGTRSFSVYVEAGIFEWKVNCTGSETFYLNTIPRASTLNVSNGTLGVGMGLSADRKSEAFSHVLTWTCGTHSGTLTGYDVNHWWFDGTNGNTVALADGAPYGDKVYITFTLKTYNGSTQVGDDYVKGIWMTIPSSVKPSCAISVTDVSEYPNGITFVQGKSKVKITINPTTAYGSPISSYSITVGGKTYYSKESKEVTVTLSSSGSVTATVEDGRGRTSDQASATITLRPYSAPNITQFKVGRCDLDGTANESGDHCKVTYGWSITALDDRNSKEVELFYRASGESEWTSIESITSYYEASDLTSIFEADKGLSYDVKMVVTDSVTGKVSKTIPLSTEDTILHFNQSGKGLAIGKVSESNGLEVGWDANFKGKLMMNGIQLTDFVVEQGTSGVWNYRKWNSGLAECFGIYSATGVNASKNNWQGFYYSDAIQVDYPFTFSARPTLTVDGGDTATMQFVREFGGTAAKASFHVVCHVDSQTSIPINVSMHAMGRWK